MSTLLLIIAVYIVADRLVTIGWVGRRIEITPALAVVSTLTGVFFVVVLLLAAFKGVSP